MGTIRYTAMVLTAAEPIKDLPFSPGQICLLLVAAGLAAAAIFGPKKPRK